MQSAIKFQIVIPPEKSISVILARAVLQENTFTNYEYTKIYGNPNQWELRRPLSNIFSWEYFKTYETASNAGHISSFKGYVDQINTLEGTIITSYGLMVLSVIVAGAAGAGAIFTGGTLTPAAWASLLAAAGASTAYVNTCVAYDRACKNAYDKYWDTFYSSTVFF